MQMALPGVWLQVCGRVIMVPGLPSQPLFAQDGLPEQSAGGVLGCLQLGLLAQRVEFSHAGHGNKPSHSTFSTLWLPSCWALQWLG
jgi:hypothetical protein